MPKIFEVRAKAPFYVPDIAALGPWKEEVMKGNWYDYQTSEWQKVARVNDKRMSYPSSGVGEARLLAVQLLQHAIETERS